MHRILLFLSFCFLLLAAPFAVAQTATNSVEERFYSDGTRALNEGRWTDAEAAFDKVIEQHGSRADAALYWKAYTQNKSGQSSKALATCMELKRSHPRSRWIDECSALEIEIRGKSGEPVLPHAEQDDDLKLLALNALMQQDESRAWPIIQQILNGNSSDKLKERAVFVLAQSQSQQAKNLLSQIARGETNPGLQVKAIQMVAAMRGAQSVDFLSEVYQHTNDARVKNAVIHAYIISGNPAKLLELVQHETHPELLRSAVQSLGALGAVNELSSLYRSTSNTQTKAAIIDGLIASGRKGADVLASIVASEPDTTLRVKAIRNLGIAGGASFAPSLVDTYQKNSNPESRKAAVEALFLAGDAHDLVALAKSEKDPAMKRVIVERLALMGNNKEAADYMLELLK